jgi:hypothetical protein
MTDDALATPAWAYERILVFDMPMPRAWDLFTDPAASRAWLLPFEHDDEGRRTTTIEGQAPLEFRVLQAEPHKFLRTSMAGGNIPGRLETNTRFAVAEPGVRIDLLHQGFGDPAGWERFGGSFSRGWDEAICDLQIHVRTGLISPRHIDDRRASIAAWPVRRDFGIELVEVFPGGFADQAGMASGDILLKLDRMGVYDIADIWAFTRAVSAGQSVTADYVRGRELLTGKGRLSRFEDFGE